MSEKVAGFRFVSFRFVVAAVELTAVRRHILGNCFATHRRQNEEKKCAWLVCCAVGAQTLNPSCTTPRRVQSWVYRQHSIPLKARFIFVIEVVPAERHRTPRFSWVAGEGRYLWCTTILMGNR